MADSEYLAALLVEKEAEINELRADLAAARELLSRARGSLAQIDDYRIDQLVAKIDAALK